MGKRRITINCKWLKSQWNSLRAICLSIQIHEILLSVDLDGDL